MPKLTRSSKLDSSRFPRNNNMRPFLVRKPDKQYKKKLDRIIERLNQQEDNKSILAIMLENILKKNV